MDKSKLDEIANKIAEILTILYDSDSTSSKEYEIVDMTGVECLSPKSIMEILNISRAEAYRLFRSKGFPSFRLGERNLRVTKLDFKLWLDEKRKQGG